MLIVPNSGGEVVVSVDMAFTDHNCREKAARLPFAV